MTIHFLVVIMFGTAALMHGQVQAASAESPSQQSASESPMRTVGDEPQDDAAHSAQVDNGKQHESGRASNEPRDRRLVPNKNQSRSRSSATKTTGLKQPSSGQLHSKSGNALRIQRRKTSNQVGEVPIGGSVQNAAISHSARSSRPSSVVSQRWSPPNNQRHRGSNPAVISGLANSRTENTGVINGTRLIRKP